MTSTAETLIDQLTLEEQVSLLSGEDFWSTPAIPRLGIGKLRVTDGPNGARGNGPLFGGVSAACFPAGIGLGATWNPELLVEIGKALAAEVKSKNAHCLLGPTVNMHRSVTNGRNFECYSEDPELASQLTAAYVSGLQSEGVAATVKHFIGNESEIERTTISSDVDEATLHEVYLRPFEAAVKDGGAWGIMSSYNKLNGTYTAENRWLLTDILRNLWGYDGIVMSDWFGSRSTAPTVNAGLDLEMPGPTRDRGAKLVAAVEAGEVTRETVRDRALAMLRFMERCGALHDMRNETERSDDTPETRALIRKAGAEGIVLLKNEAVLPLKAKTVAVIGPNASTARIMGGGSAQLNAHYAVTPEQALVDRLGRENVSAAQGCTNHRFEPLLTGDFTVEYFPNRTFTGPATHCENWTELQTFWGINIGNGTCEGGEFSVRIRGTYVPSVSGRHNFGLMTAGFANAYVDGKLVIDLSEGKWVKGRTFFEEGCEQVVNEVDLVAGKPHEILIEFVANTPVNLIHWAIRAGIGKPTTQADIEHAAQIARAVDAAILVVGRTGEWDTEGWDMETIALPGQQDDLIRAVLEANPNTVVVIQAGGPVAMPWINEAKAVAMAWYGGQEAGNSIADVLFGDVEPTGRLPQTFPARIEDNPTYSQDPITYPGLDGHVRYTEGLFVGYRHYDLHKIVPLFPFGHGLGYTDWDLESLSIENSIASVRLTNTGPKDGTTVVQIYIADRTNPGRPVKTLAAFKKVQCGAGESIDVELPLDDRAFAHWNNGWQVSDGHFDIVAGLSAGDLRQQVTITRQQ